MKAFTLASLAETLNFCSFGNDDETVIDIYIGIILLGRISFETKFFKTFFSDINARETVLWGYAVTHK